MWRAAALGLVTGLRSQLPTALLTWRQSQGALPNDITGPGRIYRRRGAVAATALLAAGELVGDKLPATPSRLDAGPFLGRLVLGGSAGVAVASAFGGSRPAGALLGVAGAATGSYLGLRYREYVAEHTDAPTVVWALLEDVVALTLGLAGTLPPDALRNTTS